jgi:hypothetical protein
MTEDTLIRRWEKNLRDLWDLWRRKKLLAVVIVICVASYIAYQIVGVEKCKEIIHDLFLMANLKITKVQLVDEMLSETTKDFPVLNDLRLRRTATYSYSNPQDLLIAVVFVVENVKAKDSTAICLDATIWIEDGKGKRLLSAPAPHFSEKGMWRQTRHVERIGYERVVRYLGIAPDSATMKIVVPYVMLLCFPQEAPLPTGNSNIVIRVKDGVANKMAEEKLPISLIRR